MLVLEPVVHRDERGFFAETYRADALREAGIGEVWVQDNQARSQRGVLRGMHFSVEPGQAKLVRCARGRLLDVVVDVRAGSPTFGKWEGVELDDERHAEPPRVRLVVRQPQLLTTEYLVLSETADVIYKCSAYYDGAKERGIAWDDPEVGIIWPAGEKIVSDRDRSAPLLSELAPSIPFTFSG